MPQPWESPAVTALLRRIVASHRRWTGRDLAGLAADAPDLAAAAFAAPVVLLAHDGGADPRFTYANRRAQELWELEWDAFIGMPSRLSAEPEQVAERQRLLERARDRGFIADYSGIRRSRSGRRFRIDGVLLWNVLDERDAPLGQAATFTGWTPLA
jgi:hypothetical protein